jgi:MFS family permease
MIQEHRADKAPVQLIQTEVFSITPRDVIQATRLFNRPRDRRRLFVYGTIAIGVLLMLACPMVIVQVFMPENADWVWRDFLDSLRQQRWMLSVLAGLALVGGLAAPLWWRYRLERAFRTDRDQYRDLQVKFSQEGIDFTWPNAALHNDWPFYQGVIEGRAYFLLTYGSLYFALPKRALAAEDALAVAQLLRQRIPRYVLRDG